jgi:putative dimethyl sulfoxide reductase chaperone
MHILVVSANPLFNEILTETIQSGDDIKIEYTGPDQAVIVIGEAKPDILIVDETIAQSELECILKTCRELPKVRTILLNPRGNDFILVDSSRASIREVGDLMQAIGIEQTDIAEEYSNDVFSELAKVARARSGMYIFLAAIFNNRPDVELVKRLRSIGVDTFLCPTEFGDIHEDVSRGLELMSDFVQETMDMPEEEVRQLLGVDWTRLFRGLRPGYGPPPPYESINIEDDNATLDVLKSLSRYYQLENGEPHNRLDYIGMELEYLGYLYDNEAIEWERRNLKEAAETSQEAMQFFMEHPGRWVEKFCENAQEQANTNFYSGFLRLCKGMIGEARVNFDSKIAPGKNI